MLRNTAQQKLGFQLLRLVNVGTIDCNATQHHNGTTTYQLSEPLPSPECDTQWRLKNGSSLTYQHQIHTEMVLSWTNQSITTKDCLTLNYTVDCVTPMVVEEVECNPSCIMTDPKSLKAIRRDERHHTMTWIVLGFFCFLFILLFSIILFFAKDTDSKGKQRGNGP
ncbi:hypothetical protein UPYG_G00156050 [Umbra pygmaea]|uniref:Uncharacterized protein n=1 Tax=Umbra pygmaea TaxID=75934 RepID=A0ABD0X2D5_UMBPY